MTNPTPDEIIKEEIIELNKWIAFYPNNNRFKEHLRIFKTGVELGEKKARDEICNYLLKEYISWNDDKYCIDGKYVLFSGEVQNLIRDILHGEIKEFKKAVQDK